MTKLKALNKLIKLRTEDDLRALDRVATEAFGPDGHVAEVGSFIGESTLRFSEHCSCVDAIDPWTDQSIIRSLTGSSNSSINIFGKIVSNKVESKLIETLFDDNTKNVANIFKFKGTYREYENASKVNCVYLDAVHTFEFTKDCINFFLREGKNVRVMAGHDYCDDWPGVIRAVDGLFGRPDRVFKDNSWVKFL